MGRNQAPSENSFSSDASMGLREYTPSTTRGQTPSTPTSEGDTQEVKPTLTHREEARRVRRQFSATPQPEMETRLRRTIKATPGGHDLARSSERRRAQRERTDMPDKATDRKQIHGESGRAMSTGTEGPRKPLRSNAQSSRQTVPRSLSQDAPSYPHPMYNYGWIPQPFAEYNLGSAGSGSLKNQPVNSRTGDHRPPSLRGSMPRHNLADPGSLLASPFEDEIPHDQGRTLGNLPGTEHPGISESRSSSATPLFRQKGSVIDTPIGSKRLGQENALEASRVARRYDLSPAQADALVQGLTDLDVLVESISKSTGLQSLEILQQLQERDGLEFDPLKIYQNLFMSRTSTELDRLPKENWANVAGRVSCPDTIQAAYEAFQEDTPHHTLFLRRWWHVHQVLLTDRGTQSRQEDFDRHTAALRKLADQASMTSGFETVFCTVGNDIRRDQSLSRTYSSSLITNFFHERLCTSDTEVESHLKAHVYDQVSRKNLPKKSQIHGGPSSHLVPENNPGLSRASGQKMVLDSDQGDRQSLIDDLDIASHQESSALDAPALPRMRTIYEGEEVDSVKKIHHPPVSDKPAITTQKYSLVKHRVTRLRQGFHNLTKHCNIPQLQTSNVQLAKMTEILSRNGWVIDNWPEGVDFPCDLKTGKGLAGLSVEDQEKLLESLNDSSFPLRVVKKSTKAIPATYPSIFGAPPAPDSQHVRGRRRFLDAERTCDRNGHPRLNHQKFEELPTAPEHMAGGDVSGGLGEQNIGIKRPAESEEEPEQRVSKRSRKDRENTAPLNVTNDTELPSWNNTDLAGSSGGDRPAIQAFSNNTSIDHTSDPGESDTDRRSGLDDDSGQPRTYSRKRNSPLAESGVHGWYPMRQAGQHPPHWAQQIMPFQFSNNQGPRHGRSLPPPHPYIPYNAHGPSVVPGNPQMPFPPFRIPEGYVHPHRSHDSK